jgi:hypothetical protein
MGNLGHDEFLVQRIFCKETFRYRDFQALMARIVDTWSMGSQMFTIPKILILLGSGTEKLPINKAKIGATYL